MICSDTVDEWIDSLLLAKRLAAQLAQADVSSEEYGRLANYDFGKIIKTVLGLDGEKTCLRVLKQFLDRSVTSSHQRASKKLSQKFETLGLLPARNSDDLAIAPPCNGASISIRALMREYSAKILCTLGSFRPFALDPLRIAFDHLGLKGPYEKAVRFAHEFGLTELSNYMLYNFHDSPADLFERMRLNVTLITFNANISAILLFVDDDWLQ